MRRPSLSYTALQALLIFGCAFCGGGSGEPPSAPNPPPSGSSPVTLAFVSERDGNAEIYVMGPDGAARLTNNPTKDVNPVWSPDGSRIAFERDGALWSMRADGSDLFQVTNPPPGATDVRQNGVPLASSDGRLIYTRAGPTSFTIRIVDFDGTNDRELTGGTVPAWSADGNLVAFDTAIDGFSDVMLIRADGSGRRDLTNTFNAHEDWPVLSPDGTRILFLGSEGMVVMNTDGTGRKAIGVGNNEYRWSPDGTQVAFRAPRAGTGDNFDLSIVNADGSGSRRLTNNSFFIGDIVWSPDGSRIAFDNGPFTSSHIYVVNPDGSGFTRLTPPGSTDYQAAFKP